MKTHVIGLIMLCASISFACVGKRDTNITEHNVSQLTDTMQVCTHADNNGLTVFLNVEFDGAVAVYDSPNGEITGYVQNDIDEEDFVLFDLLEKQDSMYYVEAYSGQANRVLARGWIAQNTSLGVYSAAYGDLQCSLYETPYNRKQITVTEKEYNPNIYEVIDYDGEWLKVRIDINGELYVGWLPPEMQCANPYTTCS